MPGSLPEAQSANEVIFFLGAGASVAAGIPAVGKMTEEFIKHIADNHPACRPALKEIVGRLNPRKPNPDIEIILRTLHRLIDHERDELSGLLKADHGIDSSWLEKLRDELQTFIRDKVIAPRNIEYLAPLLDEKWGGNGPIHIFSVNYDTCIERLCRRLERRIVDGFMPEWTPRAFETADRTAVYLYKLHGSVLWYRSQDGWPVKIPIKPNNSSDVDVELYDGKKARPIMLYPMSKQPMEAPLLDFTYILKRRLESAKFLIVIGYSFRDDYLAALFRDCFNANPDLHMISIGPDSRRHYHDLIRRDPSFKDTFEWRVTCLPFLVEKVLKDFTANQFGSLSQGIQSWQDYRRAKMVGREQVCHTFVGPLSSSGEAAMANDLMSWPSTREQMSLEAIWSAVFYNGSSPN